MLAQVWSGKTAINKGAKLERYTHADGSNHYTFRDRLGRPSNVSEAEALEIIKRWKLVDVSEEMRAAGWII